MADCTLKSDWYGFEKASRWTTSVIKCPDQKWYMYYDDDCNGASTAGTTKGWFISDRKPDANAQTDLDGDGSCDDYMYKASPQLAGSMFEGGVEGLPFAFPGPPQCFALRVALILTSGGGSLRFAPIMTSHLQRRVDGQRY